jgi:hypothetical protein
MGEDNFLWSKLGGLHLLDMLYIGFDGLGFGGFEELVRSGALVIGVRSCRLVASSLVSWFTLGVHKVLLGAYEYVSSSSFL